MVTIQYVVWTARRGQLVQTVKERTFPSDKALNRWAEKHAGNIEILRYEHSDEPTNASASW